MELKNSLKKYRLDNKLTQDDLGKKIGLSGKVISKWESGYSVPDIDNIKKLCEVFNCEYADLIGPETKTKKAKTVTKKIETKKKEVKKEEPKKENVVIKEEKKEEIVKDNVIDKQEPGYKFSSIKAIKLISRILYIFTKIYKAVFYVAIVALIIVMVFVPSMVSSVKINNNSISFSDIKGDVISITGEDILLKGDYILRYNDTVLDDDINFDVVKKVADVFESIPKGQLIIQIEMILVVALIPMIVSIVALYNLEIFFKNIRDKDNVFYSDNSNRLAMSTCLFAIVFICDIAIHLLIESIISVDLGSSFFTFRLVEILFLTFVSIVFKYGNELENKKLC